MKKHYKTLLLSVLMSMVGMDAFADYDFFATNDYGETIYYRDIDYGSTVAVAPNPNYDGYYGNIHIPSTVYDSRTGSYCSVIAIDEEAFMGHMGTSISLISIPSSVKKIGNNAFANCISLTDVYRDITDIAEWCEKDPIEYGNYGSSNPMDVASSVHLGLDDESQITELVIPDGVTTIRQGAFAKCMALTSVTIPSSVTTIGEEAFCDCQGLKSLTMAEGVKEIKTSAFNNCTALTSVTIPNSVTFIGETAIANCTKLATLTVGTGAEYLGDFCFYGCIELKDVYLWMETIPTYTESSFPFQGCMYESNTTLHVRKNLLTYYSETNPWSNFNKIVKIIDQKVPTPTIAYKDGKVKFACELESVTFVANATPLNATAQDGSEMTLTNKFRISVYATKDDYIDSDVATKDIDVRGLKGDVDGDGVVDVNDVQTTINIILKK